MTLLLRKDMIYYCGWKCCTEIEVPYHLNEVNELLSGLGMTSTHQQSVTAQQQNVTRGNVTTTAGGNATNVTAAGETTTLGGPTASQGEGADGGTVGGGGTTGSYGY